jgi:hypothetical protein
VRGSDGRRGSSPIGHLPVSSSRRRTSSVWSARLGGSRGPATLPPTQGGRSQTEIDLRLFGRNELQNVEPLGIAPSQPGEEPLGRVVAVGELVTLDQILVDALGVAPELDLLFEPLTVRLAGRWRGACRRRRVGSGSRWPGWVIFDGDHLGVGCQLGGNCPPEVLADDLAAGARPPRRAGWVTRG